MDLKNRNVLLVGDSHLAANISFHELDLSNKPKTFNTAVEPYANFKACMRMTSEYLRHSPQIDLVLIFPFLWELVFVKINKINKNSPGTLHLKEYMDYSLNGLINEVSCITSHWWKKYPGIIICWFLPFTPDFARYNNVSLYSKKEFIENQEQAKELYSRIKKFAERWSAEIPKIPLLELSECYFLNEHLMEESFLQTNFSLPHFPTVCTTDGLTPSHEFVSRFLSVFCAKMDSLLNADDNEGIRNYIRPEHLPDISSTLSTDEIHGHKERQNFQSGIDGDYHHLRSIDNVSYSSYGNSVHPPNTTHFDNGTSTFRNYDSIRQEVPMYQHDSIRQKVPMNQHDSIRQKVPMYQHDSIRQNVPMNPHDSIRHKVPMYQHDSIRQKVPMNQHDSIRQKVPMYQHDSIRQKVPMNQHDSIRQKVPMNQHDSIRQKVPMNQHDSIRQKFPMNYHDSIRQKVPMNQHGYNELTHPENWQQQHYSDYDCQDKNERTLSPPMKNYSAPQQYERSNTNTGLSEFLSGARTCNVDIKPPLPQLSIPDIPDALLNQVKDVLKSLKNTEPQPTERKPSQYAQYLDKIYNKEWTDLFLTGGLAVAFDCLYHCALGMNKLSSKKGLKLIMITSSQEFVNAAEESLDYFVEQNKLGVNNNIPFGAPFLLIDLPSNLQMRLSQPKFENLSQLVAVLVFGDCFLINKDPSTNLEFTEMLKIILNKVPGENLCKIVISESGTIEAKAYAQNILKTTLYNPKPEAAEKKRKENDHQKQSMSDLLAIQASEKDSRATIPLNLSESHKSHSREKSLSLSPKRKKKSHTPKQDHKDSSSSMDKLESIFKLAHIPLPVEKLKEYEEHDKNFMQFLEHLGNTAEKEYLSLGRNALLSHKADYKSYKEVPDIHPAFEEKYELFVKRFEEVYGQDYNHQNLQKTWKYFWEMTVTYLEDQDWKEKRKNLQEEFRTKYAPKAAEILASKTRSKGKGGKKSTSGKDGNNKKLKNPSPATNDVSTIIPSSNTSLHLGKITEDESGTLKSNEVEILQACESQNKSTNENDDEELKRIYLESCCKVAQKANAKITTNSPLLVSDNSTKHHTARQAVENKPKIVFNLSRPKSKEEKPVFSLEVALRYLETICNKIGVMGPALLSIVDISRKKLTISQHEALKVFTDKESEMLVNVAINKIKALIDTSPWSEAEVYRSALPLFQKLLSEAKKIENQSSSQAKKKETKMTYSQLDLRAIAKATVNFDTETTFDFIKNTFLYKGLREPSKEELDNVFKEISAIHFQLTMS